MWPYRIWSHLLKKSLMEDLIFCAVISCLRKLCKKAVLIVQQANLRAST